MNDSCNSEAKFNFINTMIVSALKERVVKAGVSRLNCMRGAVLPKAKLHLLHFHSLRCTEMMLKEMLKSSGAAQTLVAGSSF